MKVLLFSDIHIHPHKRSTDRLEDCLKALDWVFRTACDREIPHIIFAGDLFHDRQKIDVLTYQKTFEVFEKYFCNSLMQIHLLLGNHDLWNFQKWDVSSVHPLRNIDGISIIDKPTTRTIGGYPIAFLPYTHDPIKDLEIVEKEWAEWIKAEPNAKYKKILIGHVAVDGALWNLRFGTTSEVNIEHDGDMTKVGPEIFNAWDRVFLGHYHAEQMLNHKVEYLGSPLQLSFGEAFQKKHIAIYDLATGEIEYIENTFSPKHYIINQSEVDKYDLSNNFVRIEVDDLSSADAVDLRKDLIENKKVGSLEIKQAPKQETHVVKDAKAILYKEDEMIDRYIEEQVDLDGLDKKKLIDIGRNICVETSNDG